MVYGLTYHGRRINYEGIDMVGGVGSQKSEELLGEYAERNQSDIILTLKDPWIFDPWIMGQLKVPWVAICPVDTEPVSSAAIEAVNAASVVVAITRNGQQAFKAQGIDALYMPLGLDTKVFKPRERAEARKTLGLPEDKFIGLFVGVNNTRPSRKNIDQLILGWDSFKKAHTDALLFLHTDMTSAGGGLSLDRLVAHLKWSDVDYRVIDDLAKSANLIDRDFMATLYNAADVLVSPSQGEGFCVPLVEAQACGVPVIACNFAGQRDTAWSGWTIPSSEGLPYGEHIWCHLGAYRFRASQFAIANYLEMAYTKRGDESFKTKARSKALDYDFDNIHKKYWQPAMQQIENLLIKGVITSDTLFVEESSEVPVAATTA